MSDRLQTVRATALPGPANLPLFAAAEHGHFAEERLFVELEVVASPADQAARTAAGACDIACTAFDTVVAHAEGQGPAGPDVDPDYVAVLGASQRELSFMVAPEIETYGDLEGRSIALNAPDGGDAFVLYEMLERGGLDLGAVAFAAVGALPKRWQAVKAGLHAGTLTVEPFTGLARSAGFRLLDCSSRLFDAYQGGVVATTRAVSAENPEAVQGFIRAYLKALAWTLDAANREAASTLLRAHMPGIRPETAGAVIDSLTAERSGLIPGGAILPEGMRTVLDLRSRYGGGDAVLTDIDRYLDLSHLAAVTGPA